MNIQLSVFVNNREIRRFARFMAIGGLSTAVDFTLLILLKSLGISTLAANTVSYATGMAVNFTLNRRWTYADSRSKRVTFQFLQFALVSGSGLLLNNGLVLMFTPLFSQFSNPALSYVPAKITATLLVLLWNFSLNRLWTFNDVR